MKQKHLHILAVLFALLFPCAAWAALAVGNRFTVDGMNFQVTSVSPNEVQVGYNTQPAIDKNTQGAVIIPSSVNDSEGNSYSVTSISLMAFGGCTNLKSISIPSSITSISSSGFSGCNSITEVHITDVAAYCQINFGGGESNPLSFEGAYLYVNGIKTTDLVIPEGVTSICKHAFWKCNSLTSVTIPKGVSISMYAFYECQGLTSINCASSIDGECAFSNCPNLTSVNLLDGVETVGQFVFRDCKALANVSISASVKKLDSSFSKCTGLTTVNIEDIAAWCAMKIPFGDGSPLYYAHHLFLNGKEIKDLVIPEGVTAINSEVFNGWEALSSVIIPATVTSIGAEAFRGCTGISSVNIPSNVTNIKTNAFKGCTGLTEVHITDVSAWCGIEFSSYDGSNPLSVAKHLFLNGNEITDLIIPEGVTAIKRYVFYGWENLTSVSIPKSLTSIGTHAFDGCTRLSAVHLSDVAAWCAIPFERNASGDNPLKIAGHLYMDGVEVKDLVIPEGVTSIGYGAFNGCKSFNSVSIPSTLTKISDFAFNWVNANTVYIKDLAAWCKIKFGDEMSNNSNPLRNVQHLFVDGEEVKDLVIPDGVTSISDYAFMDCDALTSVNTGNTVKKIGHYSFAGCANLNTVTIGKSVTSIDIAFFCCKELMSVKSMIEDPFEIDNNTFTYRETADDPITGPNAILYVPVGTKAKYEATEGWKKFKNIVEFEEAPVYKDGDIFTAKTVEEIELRYTVLDATEKTCMLGVKETIEGEYYPQAFADGSAGKGTGMAYQANMFITIPSEVNGYTVKEIGNHALAASTLSGVSIPSSVDVIHDMAFYSTKISKLVIPASVKSIGNQVAVSNMLKQIIVEEGNPIYDSRNNCNAIIETATNMLILGCEETTIVEGIKIIASGALMGSGTSYGMKEIYIPKSVTTIVDNPFWYGRRIEKIVVADDNPVYDSRNNCNAIINTSTGELVTGCKKTIIPNGVKRIGKYAFSGLNTDLQIIDFPSTIVSIGVGAFTGTLLKEIILPKKLQTIETAAFRNNSVIEKIKIPASVTSIGERVFDVNQSLTEVTSMIKKPFPLNPNAFQSLEYYAEQVTLYVPAGTKALYEATDGWKEFKNIVEMEPEKPYEVKNDGTAIVKNLEPDENGQLVIPEKVDIDGKEYPVTEIAPEAFKDNQDLVEVTIPGTVTTISAGAFAGCGNLTAIYIQSSTPASMADAAARGMIRRADGTTVSQFEGVDFETCVLYVPYGSEEAYREAEGWKQFKHIVGVHSEKDPATTVTAKSYTREYGEENPKFEVTTEGVELDGEPVIECEATEKSDAGTYDIIVKKGTVMNYNDTYVKGTLTVTKAPLKVTVKDVEREQGTDNPQFEISYEGWKLSDSESVLLKKPVATTTATKESPIGEYDITVSGGEAKNYELTYQKGKLTVVVPAGIYAMHNSECIMHNKWYDLKGRRISQPKKGVNILRNSNGKRKVVVIK